MTYQAWFYLLLGFVVGSFLNVVIDRVPQKQSLLNPPSHCPHCQQSLKFYDLIPVISYLILRARCRYCEEKIPVRILLVELATGLLFLFAWLKFGPGWYAVVISVYIAFLICITVIDIEHQIIPNLLVYPAIGLSILMVPLFHLNDWTGYLLGGVIGFGVLYLIGNLAPGAMGLGDVKLAVFLGLMTGYPGVVVAFFLAFVMGGLIAGILLAFKKIARKDPIAFGPFLALGGYLALIYGDMITAWWIRMVNG